MSDVVSRFEEAAATLLAPGASHELARQTINGVSLPVYSRAPGTLREALAAGRQFGEKDFIVYQGERWSFNRFFEDVDALAHQLVHRLKVSPGDRVAIAMRNYPEWMVALTAVVSSGAIVVPLNSWGQADEIEHGLTDAMASLVICDQQRHEAIASRLAGLDMAAIVVRPEPGYPGEAISWDTLIDEARGQPLPEVPVAPEDPVLIMYTSGTTGRPKGAVSTNRAICQALYNFEFHGICSAMANPDAIGKMLAAGFEPATLLAVPLFHVSGCFAVFMLSLRGGRKVAIMYKWDVQHALALIAEERITAFTGVPAMSLELLESPDYDQSDTRSLFAIGLGGAACPPHLRELIYQKLPDGFPGTGYGMTETNATGASCTGDAFRELPGTSGRISPIVAIKTVDESGADLAQGQRGELLVRSPTNASGYWNLPEASAETFMDGWVATGDVGYIDDNNYLFVVDRIKDMVIRGGENIYPVEIEGCLLEHPRVIEVAAFGVPHERWGEELAVTAYCSGDTGAGDLQRWVGDRLAAFKVPTHVALVSEPLPRNPTGKILKQLVRQRFLDSRVGAGQEPN